MIQLSFASWKFSDDEKSQIVSLWLSGLSTKSVGKMCGIDLGIRLLIRHRIPRMKYLKTAKEHMKKIEKRKELKRIKIPKLSEDLGWWMGLLKVMNTLANNYIYVVTKDENLGFTIKRKNLRLSRCMKANHLGVKT